MTNGGQVEFARVKYRPRVKRGNDKRRRRRKEANGREEREERNDTRKHGGNGGRRRACSGPMLSTGTVPVLKHSGGVEERRGRNKRCVARCTCVRCAGTDRGVPERCATRTESEEVIVLRGSANRR